MVALPPARVAVVAEAAGVGVRLGEPGQLLVPLQLEHVRGAGVRGPAITIITITIVIILSSSLLGPPAPRHGGPELVVVVQHLLPLRGGEAPRVGGAAPLLGRWGGQRHGDRSED